MAGWYLPSTCELGSGLYYSANNGGKPFLANCENVPTGVFSLYGLGLVPVLYSGAYWSSTEQSLNHQTLAAWHYFAVGGGGYETSAVKFLAGSVRCTRAVPF